MNFDKYWFEEIKSDIIDRLIKGVHNHVEKSVSL